MSLLVQSILGLTIICNALLCVYTSTSGRRNAQQLFFFIHLVNILGWAMATLYALVYGSVFAAHAAYICALALAVAKYFFAQYFPRNERPAWYMVVLPLLLALVGFIIALVPGGVFLRAESVDGIYVRITDGPLAEAFALIVVFFLLQPLGRLYRVMRTEAYSHIERAQAQWLLIGMSFFFVVGILTNSILPVFFDIYILNGVGPSFSLVLAGFIAYIVSRYQFLKLGIVIQRSFVYAAIFVVIASIYLCAVNALGFFFTNASTPTLSLLGGFLAASIGALSVPTIDRWLRRLTNPVFFGKRYDYATALAGLVEITNTHLSHESIVNDVKESLNKLFNPEALDVSVSFVESASVLQHESSYVLTIPCTMNGQEYATLKLGAKRSGHQYTKEDISLLETFADHCALAFEKARLYAEVETYSRKLEEKVAQRTQTIRDLQEQQNQTLVDLAHRLQEPLTVATTELSHASPAHRDTQIAHAIDEMSMFVKGILALAHIEVAAHLHKNSKTHLTPLLHELVEYYATLAESRDITLASHIADGLMVNGERDRISEALTNVVANAMKYMHTDMVRERSISISAHATVDAVVVVVSDTGIGIAPEDMSRVFDRFFRTARRETRVIPGTGLGLAITKRIVEACGGSVSLSSVLGSGTTITIRFVPAQSLNDAVLSVHATPSQQPRASSVPLS